MISPKRRLRHKVFWPGEVPEQYRGLSWHVGYPRPDAVLCVMENPAPQGSKRYIGGGRMIESSAKVKPWREAVGLTWIAAGLERITGPVRIDMTFTLPRPNKTAPDAVPDKRPDLDKLCRSTLDALTKVLAIEDDARVVELTARKVYPLGHPEVYGLPHPDALERPGAVIRIWQWEKQPGSSGEPPSVP